MELNLTEASFSPASDFTFCVGTTLVIAYSYKNEIITFHIDRNLLNGLTCLPCHLIGCSVFELQFKFSSVQKDNYFK